VVAPLLLTGLRADTPIATLLVAYLILGVGFGMVNAPITNAAVSGMPRAQAGVAAAIATTSRQIGLTLGVAVAGAIVATRSAADATGGGFAEASRPGWWLLAGCGAVVLVVGHLATTDRAKQTAVRTAAALDPEAESEPGPPSERSPSPGRDPRPGAPVA
jgi:hypothetical protein